MQTPVLARILYIQQKQFCFMGLIVLTQVANDECLESIKSKKSLQHFLAPGHKRSASSLSVKPPKSAKRRNSSARSSIQISHYIRHP